jgi:hypothetical protein
MRSGVGLLIRWLPPPLPTLSRPTPRSRPASVNLPLPSNPHFSYRPLPPRRRRPRRETRSGMRSRGLGRPGSLPGECPPPPPPPLSPSPHPPLLLLSVLRSCKLTFHHASRCGPLYLNPYRAAVTAPYKPAPPAVAPPPPAAAPKPAPVSSQGIDIQDAAAAPRVVKYRVAGEREGARAKQRVQYCGAVPL